MPARRKSQFKTLIALAVVSLTACETTVEIDFPRHDPVMVLSSFFYPEAPFELCLNEARDLVDGQDAIRSIGNARVELLEDGRTIEVLTYAGDCLYRSTSRKPVPGKSYMVRASADGYEAVEAADVAPSHVETEFEWEFDRRGSDAGSIDATIYLHDPDETDNWYRMMVFYRHYDPEGRAWYQTPGFDTDDQAILADNQDFIDLGDSGNHETVFFRDDLLEHTASGHRIRIEVPAPYDGTASTRSDLLILVDHISEHFYDYATTERIHRSVEDNPFAEPVQVATNVKNGFGIFGGFNRSAFDVQVR